MHSKILNTINSLKDSEPKSLEKYINENLYGKKIVLYGAGGFGREIFNVLTNHNIKPDVFLDIKASGELLNTPIVNPADYNDKEAIVLLSIVLNKKTRTEIYSFLQKLGYKSIIDAQTIRAMYIELEGNNSFEYFKAKEKDILKPLDYLADDESKETYAKNVIAHITRNYENTAETDEITQYFVERIPFKKGISSFIDCGAYIGDTFLKLSEQPENIRKYIGFEPIPETFKELTKTLSTTTFEAIAFPSAVSDKTGIIKFNCMLGSSCATESGNTSVMCVKLDEVLYNFNPTFIKMDIEGEEIKALNGAKNLISKTKPELAICVYHYINHFWEIPNMLYNWNLGYEFYLRTHSSACMETVLYAVSKD